jgi:3-deoxy-manno-octulosonate cytidylyltransferase (CMP-KDO synthetase)
MSLSWTYGSFIAPHDAAVLPTRSQPAQTLSSVVIIPARMGSSRFHGKPLAPLRGASGRARPLVQRSWQAAHAAAQNTKGCAGAYVATDSEEIANMVRSFGGQVVMTPKHCRNGTERCAAAVAQLGLGVDVVVNWQGDAPLTPPGLVGALVAALAQDAAAAMATPALTCSPAAYRYLAEEAAANRVGGTLALADATGRALYFSRRMIPFVQSDVADPHRFMRLHLGLYAYRQAALAGYARWPMGPLEQLEGLEQLRFLEQGAPVRLVPAQAADGDCLEVNNPQDVPVIETILAQRGID